MEARAALSFWVGTRSNPAERGLRSSLSGAGLDADVEAVGNRRSASGLGVCVRLVMGVRLRISRLCRGIAPSLGVL